MADEVIWNPRNGNTGDDRYGWPDQQRRVDVGDSSGYSTTPTIIEVNAGTDLNQLVAELRRRYKLVTLDSPPSYLTSVRFAATNFSNLKKCVDLVRTHELSSSYSWLSTLPAANAPLTEAYFFELRKALSRKQHSIESWACFYEGTDRLRYNTDDNDLTEWIGSMAFDYALLPSSRRHLFGVTENYFIVGNTYSSSKYRISKSDFTWSKMSFGSTYINRNIHTIGSRLFCIVGASEYFSDDEGSNWTQCSFPATDGGLNLAGVISLPYELGGDLICVVKYGTARFVCSASTDNGATWATRGVIHTSGFYTASDFVAISTGIWAVPSSLKSTDGGATWSGFTFEFANYTDILYGVNTVGIGSAIVVGNRVSTDDAATWSTISGMRGSIFKYGGELYGLFINGSYYEIKKTTDGTNWTSVAITNLPTSQPLDYGMLRIGAQMH